MGWSYGGYLTAWAIGHTTRFKAASVGAGIADLISQAGAMDLPDFIPLYFGGEAWKKSQILFDRSPLKYAGAITTPTLFQHGLEDERVPFGQSMPWTLGPDCLPVWGCRWWRRCPGPSSRRSSCWGSDSGLRFCPGRPGA